MSEHEDQRHCINCDGWYPIELKQCPHCGYVYERDREPKADDDPEEAA
jgi:hypothetical protein